ncbi:hypothetical protein [Actinospica robiniae]|uniref:hypothetical protein n=1 Tax=Actinospica robiniae TaxID=304901 RepID=UPI0004058111|nr:hypothetical protein [Actinospica robiniae]
MKESTPRRIAAGALFTAAVGFSVGAIAAPAQADAFTPQHTARIAAYVPDVAGHNGMRRSFDARLAPNAEFATRFLDGDPCGCSPDRTRGHDENYGVLPLVSAIRQPRIDEGHTRPAVVLRDDRRDCPPNRGVGIRPEQDVFSTISYTVHQAGDDRRDCPPDRGHVRTSDYGIDHVGRVVDQHGHGNRHGDEHGRSGRGHGQSGHGHGQDGHGHGGHGSRGRR